MDITSVLSLVVCLILLFTAIYFKPLRKTTGLLLVILGAIVSFTFIGMVIGIPMIIIGGILLFV